MIKKSLRRKLRAGHRLLSIPEVAQILERSESTIRNYICRGILPAVKLGTWRIRAVDAIRLWKHITGRCSLDLPTSPDTRTETQILRLVEDTRDA